MSSVEQTQGVASAEVTQRVPLTQLQETRSTNQTEGYVQSESIQRIPTDLGSPSYKVFFFCVFSIGRSLTFSLGPRRSHSVFKRGHES